MKENTDKLNFIKVKIFCSLKRQAIDWKKIFTKHLFNVVFVYKICKKIFKLK